MKLLVIIADGASQIRIEATRAPDLRRRAISAATGCGEILFCAAPPPGYSAEGLVAVLSKKLPANAGTARARARIRRQALWCVEIKPMLKRVVGKMRTLVGIAAVLRFARAHAFSAGGRHV